MKHGILSVQGAKNPSCVFTIEYNSRKIPGVKDVHVDINCKTIHVDYYGTKKVLSQIQSIINKLGYNSDVVSKEIN